MSDRKRPPIVMSIVLLLIGLTGFDRLTQSSSFALYRTVDIVQLLACGGCFAASMVGVIVSVLRTR